MKIANNILEITNRDQFKPKIGSKEMISIYQIRTNPKTTHSMFNNFSFNLEDNLNVSSNFNLITSYFTQPEVHIYIGVYQNEVIGYFDFIFTPDHQIEIRNFGFTLNPENNLQCRLLISKAVEFGLEYNPKRLFINPSFNQKFINFLLSLGFQLNNDIPLKQNNSLKLSSVALISNFLINYN